MGTRYVVLLKLMKKTDKDVTAKILYLSSMEYE